VNGMSTSLRWRCSGKIVRSIPGLDEAEMLRPGYAIEYDSVDATAAGPDLAREGL